MQGGGSVNYDELRAKAAGATHGYSYRGFGYAAYIAAASPDVVLGLLDRIAELVAALDWIRISDDGGAYGAVAASALASLKGERHG